MADLSTIPIERAVELKQKYGLSVAVETGTYKGTSTRLLAQHFDWVYTIEGYSPRLEKTLRSLGDHRPAHVAFLYGDSRVELARVLATINQPCLLWLDAHYCNESFDPNALGGECPLREELEAVNASAHAARHVILIDDARYFTGRPEYPHDPAQWMTYAEIRALLAPRRPYIVEDVIYAEPVNG